MQKKSLVIFSLLTLSVLLIAGCQEAVGGFPKLRTSGDQTYSLSSHRYSSGPDRFVFDLTVQQGGRCILLSGSVPIREIVAIESRESSENYLVVGCISATADPTSGTIGAKAITDKTFVSTNTPNVVLASQFSRALLLQLDQRLSAPETVLSSDEVFVIRGSVVSTGF